MSTWGTGSTVYIDNYRKHQIPGEYGGELEYWGSGGFEGCLEKALLFRSDSIVC